MPNRPANGAFGEGLVIGTVLAAATLLLLLFGARIFNSGEKSVVVSQTQPSIEAPVTGDNKKP